MKNFEVKVVLDEGAFLPQSAHQDDAGYDLFSPVNIKIPYRESVLIDTGVHIQIPKGYFISLRSKSGLNCIHGITSDGVIDCGYTGSIRVKLYNNAYKDYEVCKGDKISQIIFQEYAKPKLIIADELEETERGNNGFGSTGR